MGNKIIKQITSDTLILVEGNDDKHFLESFIKRSMSICENRFDIFTIESKSQYKKEISNITKISNFNRVKKMALFSDADDKKAYCTFDSLSQILKNNHLPTHDKIAKFSEFQNLNNSKISIGIFIFPDLISEGTLEDLVLASIECESIKKCLNQYLNCLNLQENNEYRNSKSKMLAYLASFKQIKNSLGFAAKAGYFNFDHNCFSKLTIFLKDLFKE